MSDPFKHRRGTITGLPFLYTNFKKTNMIKVYEAIKQNSARLCTTYCGILLELNFVNGNQILGRNAELMTNNRFVQDAIEHDKRFGLSIRLKRTYPEPSDKAAKPLARAAKTVQKKSTEKAEEDVKKAEEVASVTNTNDAIAYFLERGESPEGDLDIEALKKKYNVSFPNLK